MPLDSPQDDALEPLGDLEDFSDDVYSGAHPALIIGDEIDDATFAPSEESQHHGHPWHWWPLNRPHEGVIMSGEEGLEEDTLGAGDALRSDKQGITG